MNICIRSNVTTLVLLVVFGLRNSVNILGNLALQLRSWFKHILFAHNSTKGIGRSKNAIDALSVNCDLVVGASTPPL